MSENIIELELSTNEQNNSSNVGKKWSSDEEKILLEELKKNIDVVIIAQNHCRTLGGINSRRRDIAYKMYLDNVPINEIVEKTKLDEEYINQIINKKSVIQNNTRRQICIESEIAELKTEIKEINKKLEQIIKMMKDVFP